MCKNIICKPKYNRRCCSKYFRCCKRPSRKYNSSTSHSSQWDSSFHRYIPYQHWSVSSTAAYKEITVWRPAHISDRTVSRSESSICINYLNLLYPHIEFLRHCMLNGTHFASTPEQRNGNIDFIVTLCAPVPQLALIILPTNNNT